MSFIPKTCTYCRESAGSWEQWPHVPDGEGVCTTCADLLTETTTRPDLLVLHGVEGIHWGSTRNPFLQDSPLPRADGFIGLTHWERDHARAAIAEHQRRIGIAPSEE